MKKIFLVFFSLFLTQCSTSVDPESAWLTYARGMWCLTETGREWLTDAVSIGATIDDSMVIIGANGDLTIISVSVENSDETSKTYSFMGIDTSGVFAVYQIASLKYIAIGFNSDYDILYNANVSTSTDITSSSTGNIFLTRYQ